MAMFGETHMFGTFNGSIHLTYIGIYSFIMVFEGKVCYN